MNKKAVDLAINSIVPLILILFVFLILLGLLPPIQKILIKTGNQAICEGSFIVSAMTKSSGTSKIEPECQTYRITLVEKPAEEKESETEGTKMALDKDYVSPTSGSQDDTFNRVTAFNNKYKDPSDAQSYGLRYPYFDDYEKERTSVDSRSDALRDAGYVELNKYVRERYNMDKIVSDEMLRCWDIVGQGRLDMFDNWFNFFDCDGKACDLGGAVDKLIKKDVKISANFCVLCARIKFDDKIKTQYPGIELDNRNSQMGYSSINRWMANNPAGMGKKETAYEYILDDYQKKSFFSSPRFMYSTQEPYAVVFIRLNFQELALNLQDISFVSQQVVSSVIPSVTSPKGEKIYWASTMALLPYSKLADSCDYLVGSYI